MPSKQPKSLLDAHGETRDCNRAVTDPISTTLPPALSSQRKRADCSDRCAPHSLTHLGNNPRIGGRRSRSPPTHRQVREFGYTWIERQDRLQCDHSRIFFPDCIAGQELPTSVVLITRDKEDWPALFGYLPNGDYSYVRRIFEGPLVWSAHGGTHCVGG